MRDIGERTESSAILSIVVPVRDEADNVAVELLRKASIQRVLYSIAATIGGLCATAVAYLVAWGDKRIELIADYDIDPLGPLA
jgi:hypothetical protein